VTDLAAPPSPTASAAAQAPSPAPFALRALFVGLMLYAAFGKGFAYAGWPPVFVGEVLLATVLVASLRTRWALPTNAAAGITAGLLAMAAVQFVSDRLGATVPLLETLRGLAPVYYSALAFGAYALLRDYELRVGRRAVIDAIGRAAARAAPFVLGVLLVLSGLLLVRPPGLPVWPASGVPVLLTKPGDIAVALVLFVPLVRSPALAGKVRLPPSIVMTMVIFTGVLITFRSRGALLALVVGLIVARPNPVRIARGLLAATAVLLLLFVTGLRFEVSQREVSFDAARDAAASLVASQPDDEIGSNLVGTRNWRAEWWSGIWDDATDERMVLHGHGWGDNLAVRYGVIAPTSGDEARVLRLPHSIAFSLIGRAGIVFAVGFLAVPVVTIVRSLRQRSSGAPGPLVNGARGAVAAALVTSLSGVYIESPQGGILLWSLLGFLWWATARPIGGPDPGADHVRDVSVGDEAVGEGEPSLEAPVRPAGLRH
jgi:hypothetical protein